MEIAAGRVVLCPESAHAWFDAVSTFRDSFELSSFRSSRRSGGDRSFDASECNELWRRSRRGSEQLRICALTERRDSPPYNDKAFGMWAGAETGPLLSTDPKPTIDQEKSNPVGSGFLCEDVAAVTVGVVCDFARNTLTFYLDDKPVRYTLIPDPNGKVKSKPFEPFVWSIPPTSKLSQCCVYFAVADSGVRAEFVHWTPPPPPPPPPPTTTQA